MHQGDQWQSEDNLHDQSFHDSRYYAEVASGEAHHLAWKNEKGRRRAILKRKSGVADRARERTHLDGEWHKKHEPFKTGSKRHDVEGLEAELETEIIDDRRRDLRQAFGASEGSRTYEPPGEGILPAVSQG